MNDDKLYFAIISNEKREFDYYLKSRSETAKENVEYIFVNSLEPAMKFLFSGSITLLTGYLIKGYDDIKNVVEHRTISNNNL